MSSIYCDLFSNAEPLRLSINPRNAFHVAPHPQGDSIDMGVDSNAYFFDTTDSANEVVTTTDQGSTLVGVFFQLGRC